VKELELENAEPTKDEATEGKAKKKGPIGDPDPVTA
jgi:hypothetical protein